MKRQQLVETLTKCGFSVINQASWGKARLSGDMSGSLYAADNYLSATGDYALFQEKVPPSERDHNDYPIWKDEALRQVVSVICGDEEK